MQSDANRKNHPRGHVVFWLLGLALGVAAATWAAPRLKRCCAGPGASPLDF